MAEVKISELSVGDWVRVDDFDKVLIKRVSAIDGTRNQIGIIKNNRGGIYWYCDDEIEPILLTPEILEKNGFVKCGRCCTSRTTAYIKDFTFVNHLEERKVWRVKIYGEEGLVELCSILVHHIHQLQHALRLAGVENEIEV